MRLCLPVVSHGFPRLDFADPHESRIHHMEVAPGGLDRAMAEKRRNRPDIDALPKPLGGPEMAQIVEAFDPVQPALLLARLERSAESAVARTVVSRRRLHEMSGAGFAGEIRNQETSFQPLVAVEILPGCNPPRA